MAAPAASAGAGAAADEAQLRFERAQLVPSRELQGLELVDVLVARIPARLANQLIKSLGSALPLADLKHLKRVRKSEGDASSLEILLCHAAPAGTEAQGHQPQSQGQGEAAAQGSGAASGVESAAGQGGGEAAHQQVAELGQGAASAGAAHCLPAAAAALVAEYSLQPEVVQVPAKPPQTRAQWEEWAGIWPMAWKIPDGKAPPTGEELLASDRDQQYFEVHMRAVLAAVTASGRPNAARIVDPVTGQVVAEGLDCRAEHPLHHAAMVVVKAAAARDLATWPPTDAPAASAAVTAASAAPAASAAQAGAGAGPAAAGAGVMAGSQGEGACPSPVIEGSAAKKQRVGEAGTECARSSSVAAEEGAAATAAAGSGQGSLGLSAGGAVPGPKPYMCTGYDCFLAFEPCIMCAMGLVHSRLTRVIYCHSNAVGGALGGQLHLMAHKSLNHHYDAYKMPLAGSGEGPAAAL